MSRPRALVVHTRMPAADRDAGSQIIDDTIRFLLDAGWIVTFLSKEEEGVAEERHANRLRQLGVATYAGFGWAERILRSNSFDLALTSFWEPTSQLLPLIRKHSPGTRVIINSIDVHFLRNARLSFGKSADLDDAFGRDAARELNVYHAVDAVIAVSEKERGLLADFVGEDRVFTLQLAEDVARSPVPLADRRGMFFVGNFRHLPNQEAVEFLCREILPMLDPELLRRHPLTVLGNWLQESKLAIAPMPGLNLVGWVPTVQPYVERSRIGVMTLLHGAGVKHKVIQTMMAYTPVVTTPVGAEGLDLVPGEHALIASNAGDLSAGITRLLTDDDLWHRIASHGADHIDARHGRALVETQFQAIIDRVMAQPPRGLRAAKDGRTGGADADDEAVRRRAQTIADPGAVVLVAAGAGDRVVDLGPQPARPFPDPGAGPAFDPADGRAAVHHLEAQIAQGARYLVLPKAAFPWRYRYPELHDHLEARYRRVHQDEHLWMYDLADPDDRPTVLLPTPTARVRVEGTYDAVRSGPPPALVTELGRSTRLVVDQHWRSDVERRGDAAENPADAAENPADAAENPADAADDPADFTVYVRDDAIVPSRFLDDLIATQVTLDVDRIQPAHCSGPASGPPITERHRGTVARLVDAVTPLPVLSVRGGAEADGPVALADEVTVGLRSPIVAPDLGDAYRFVRRVWVADEQRHPIAWDRAEPVDPPRISVLISTYDRPDLLREALTWFAKQTLDRAEYEVVVVDDGSREPALEGVVREFAEDLQIIGLRIGHVGRSAAKNHAVLLARAPIVLFFDDDDRASADYLERHLLAHEAKPAETVAVLGHTDWAPELERTPLMHYITDVARLMFAYERLGNGQELDWRGFWEGRVSCKRSLLLRHGLHDQRLNYSIDVEMAWRLARHGLRVVYDTSAVSQMARGIELDAFCARTEAKGRAHAIVAALHPGTEIAGRVLPAGSVSHWNEKGSGLADLRRRTESLEALVAKDESALPQLHDAYGELFRLMHAKGVAEPNPPMVAMTHTPTTVHPFPNTDPDLVHDGTPAGAPAEPLLSITIPVWSRTPKLAAMAQRTIERIWEVSRVPTEVVVVDNGSPHEVPLAAKVYRYPENKGVATGWNTGLRLATADTLVVMNSDCMVEPGWDEALYEAANDGRRVAFPYTDHCDGRGFTQPDQGGTAGWCFMLSRAVHDEVGVFDEWFNPAFCEDTDYWHRAWQLGIELTPVPAARVVHARRTTANTTDNVDMLLLGHRYKYGWKHSVDPLRAPPYYERTITEYHGSFEPRGGER